MSDFIDNLFYRFDLFDHPEIRGTHRQLTLQHDSWMLTWSSAGDMVPSANLGGKAKSDVSSTFAIVQPHRSRENSGSLAGIT